jgi:hypothetical protein
MGQLMLDGRDKVEKNRKEITYFCQKIKPYDGDRALVAYTMYADLYPCFDIPDAIAHCILFHHYPIFDWIVCNRDVSQEFQWMTGHVWASGAVGAAFILERRGYDMSGFWTLVRMNNAVRYRETCEMWTLWFYEMGWEEEPTTPPVHAPTEADDLAEAGGMTEADILSDLLSEYIS